MERHSSKKCLSTINKKWGRHPLQETEDDKKVVIVIDEKSNKYESTYPKRARGLNKVWPGTFS